jgi:hypothetical protein
MNAQSLQLPIKQTAGEGAESIDLSAYERVTIQISGITSSVLALEASLDGVVFSTIKTPLANGIHTLDDLIDGNPAAVMFLRVNTTSIANGETPVVTYLAQTLNY